MTKSDNSNGRRKPGPNPNARGTDSGVDKMLSRFGPVGQPVQERPIPGPKPASSTTLNRPEQGRRSHPAGDLHVPEPAGAPLFDQPHDEAFGDDPIEVDAWAASDQEQVLVPAHPEEVVEIIDRRDWVRVPRRTGPVIRFLIVGFVLFVGVFAIYGQLSSWWQNQYDPEGDPGAPVEFAIPAGATANDVTQQLYADGVITNPTLFRYWTADNFDGEFQAGEYVCLQENMSFEEALGCLADEGPVPPKFFSITIPEGLRLHEIIDVLNAENPSFTKADLEKNLDAALVNIGLTGTPDGPLPGNPDPTGSGKEGVLFPATYQIDEKKESDSLDILRRMADTMDQKFEQAIEEEGRSQVIVDLELTDYEVLTVASLIEEEYLIDEDLGRISRVIYNRLAHGSFSLGIDATSCYAAQKPCADLTSADLTSDSPWNTRDLSNYGLPPPPIASPGEKAIRAALNPTEGDWLYYVRTEEDGGHTFAATEGEFQAAKRICQERGYC